MLHQTWQTRLVLSTRTSSPLVTKFCMTLLITPYFIPYTVLNSHTYYFMAFDTVIALQCLHALCENSAWYTSKWPLICKSTFLTCHYHKIPRVEAIGPTKVYLYSYTLNLIVVCKIKGKFVKKLFCQWLPNQSWNLESKNPFAHVMHMILNNRRTLHFDFQLKSDFPSQFCLFTLKSLSVFLRNWSFRSVSQENAFEKS